MQTRRGFLRDMVVFPVAFKALAEVAAVLTIIPGCAEEGKRRYPKETPLGALLRAKGSNVKWYTYHGQTTWGTPLDGAFVEEVDGKGVLTYDLDGVIPTTGAGETPLFAWKTQTWYDVYGQPAVTVQA